VENLCETVENSFFEVFHRVVPNTCLWKCGKLLISIKIIKVMGAKPVENPCGKLLQNALYQTSN